MDAPARFEAFVQMLGHLQEPLLLVSREGRILAANAAGGEALGTSVAALEGTALVDYAVPTGIHGRGAPPTSEPFPVRARDGRPVFCQTSPLTPELLLARISGASESTERARAFAEKIARFQGVAVGASVVQRIEELACTLLRDKMASVGALAGGIYLLDETGTSLELKGSVNYPAQTIDRYRFVPLTGSPLPLADAFRRRAPVFVGSAEEFETRYPAFTHAHPESATRSLACIPLTVDGRSLGALGLGLPMPWTFTDAQRAALEALGADCARALGDALRAEAEQRRWPTEEASRRLERLHAFTGALAGATTPSQVAEAVVDMGIEAVGAPSGWLWLLTDDRAAVRLVRRVGDIGPSVESHPIVPLVGGMPMPTVDAVVQSAPVWIESFRQLQDRYPDVARLIPVSGERSFAALPLFAQGRCIGALSYSFDRVHRFREDERAFLQVIAWHAAQALERARLLAAERAARATAEAAQRRSEFLADAGTLLGSSLDYQLTLAAVAQAAVPAVAEWCIVELAGDGPDRPPPVGAHVDPALIPLVLELSRRYRDKGPQERGIPGVLRSGKSELYPDLTPELLSASIPDDPELGSIYLRMGLVSSMIVPISARGQTLGAILLNSADPGRRYDAADLEMAEELGRRAGLAVDNARLYREAQQANRVKDEFLAMLGHELRNPLAPILTTLELQELRGADDTAGERALLLRNVKHVMRLVDDLLDVARITRGRIQLVKERCAVAEVIAKAVEMVTPLVAEKKQRLVLEAPAGALFVQADPHRLAQAIANLLTNAAKYSPSGSELVVASRAEGGEAAVEVRDPGVGIAREVLPHLFSPFAPGRSAPDRAPGGLGIGLSIVKGLVELHGGTVAAHSDGPGRGSRFTIRLPLAAAAPVVAPAPRSARPAAAAGLRVLVVDDNLDARDSIADMFRLFGCVLEVADDGPSALAAADSFGPDLVVLDLGLPGMDGFEVARRLRRHARLGATRLVALTGYGQESDRLRARDAGFDEHIVKPMEVETLRRLLEPATT